MTDRHTIRRGLLLILLTAGLIVGAMGLFAALTDCKIDPLWGSTEDIYEIIWQWDCEETYAAGAICWLGLEDGQEMDWRSLQDDNLGHRPVMYGSEPVSPDWWERRATTTHKALRDY